MSAINGDMEAIRAMNDYVYATEFHMTPSQADKEDARRVDLMLHVSRLLAKRRSLEEKKIQAHVSQP